MEGKVAAVLSRGSYYPMLSHFLRYGICSQIIGYANAALRSFILLK
jgi:hypothetical protein